MTERSRRKGGRHDAYQEPPEIPGPPMLGIPNVASLEKLTGALEYASREGWLVMLTPQQAALVAGELRKASGGSSC